MARHLLSDRRIRLAKPKVKPYRLFDGEGLALLVSPTGVKSWQLRYRLDGKDQTLTLGKIERLTLAEARDKAQEQRALVARGTHLTQHKRAVKLKHRVDAANTFAAVSADWMAREARRQKWTLDYASEVAGSIRNHLSPLESLPISTLNAPTIAPLLRAVEMKAPMMLEKVRRRLNAILDFSVEHGIIQGNPLPAVRRGSKVARKHYPAVTDLDELGAILRAAQSADPCKGIQRAHLLLAFTAQRVSEVVGARWDEFELDGIDLPTSVRHRNRRDLGAGNWSIPRERMKRKDQGRGPHILPLPSTLLAALREWRKADGDGALYVCPAPRDPNRPITPEAIEKFYRRALGLAGKHSPHSWRSAFSSVAREAAKDADVIEAQLDHVVGNKVSSAYDRATRLELRRELLTWYEQSLLASRDGADVVSITNRRA